MQKISVSVPDSTTNAIDAEVKRLGISRSHFVSEAIDFYVGTGRNLKTRSINLRRNFFPRSMKTNHYQRKYYAWKKGFLL